MQARSGLLQTLTKVLTMLLSLIGTFETAAAADFFVRPGGSGNGSTWTAAAGSPNSAPSGSTVYVAGGTYSTWNLSGKSNLIVKRATAASHGSDTGWQASYDSQAVLGPSGGDCITMTSGSGSITIDGSVRNGIWARGCYHSIRTTVPNVTLRNLELGGTGTLKNGEDGIQGNGDNLLIEYCNIHDNDNIDTHGDGIQWFSGNNVVMRYNIFKNNGQMMMLTETAWGNDYVTNLEIHHNVFYNRGGAHYNGISKKLCPPTGQWKVYNNTFDLEAKSDSGYDNIFSGAGSCTAMDFRNNAVLNSAAGSLGNVSHAYNGFDNSAPLLVYQIPGTETGKVVAADLGMVDVANADYRLKSTSPLIGKGQNLGYTRDFDGNPVGATPSIGAFEYSSGGTTPPPTDTAEPTRSAGTPTGTLAFGTTSTAIALATNEKSVCKYSESPGVAFSSMTGTMTANSSGLSHSANVSGLSNGQTYKYYVRCQDMAGNTNGTDFQISFSVAQPTDPVVEPPSNLRIKSMRVE